MARVLALFVALLVLGCGSTTPRPPRGPDQALLDHVPDETAYIYAILRPLKEALAASTRTGTLTRMKGMLDGFARVEGAPGRFAAELAKVVDADAANPLRGLGFRDDARLVLYGHGLSPVLRATGVDLVGFQRWLRDAAGRAGIGLTTERVEGRELSIIALTGIKLHVVVAVDGDQLVIAVLPDAISSVHGSLFRLPPSSFTGRAAAIIAAHDADGVFSMIDGPRVAGLFLDDPLFDAVANRDFRDALFACPGGWQAIAAALPRLVIALGASDARATHARFDLALSPGAAALASSAMRPVPHWPAAPLSGVQLEFGVGIDAGMVMAGLSDWFDRVAASPACTGALPTTLRQGANGLRAMVGTPLAELRGFTYDLRYTDDPHVAATVILATPHPRAVLDWISAQLGGQKLPELPAHQLIRLPIPALNAALGGVSLQLEDDALGLAIGPGAGADLSALLAAPAGPALLVMRGDGAFTSTRPLSLIAPPEPVGLRPLAPNPHLGIFELQTELRGDLLVSHLTQHLK